MRELETIGIFDIPGAVWKIKESQHVGQSSHHRPAARFVDGLLQAGVEHRAVRHPYLRALGDGELPDIGFALADFARQYSLYAKWFPRCLSVVAAKLSNAEHREPLLANLG